MEEKNDSMKKKVDEAWKESAHKEKTSAGEAKAAGPEVTFGVFIYGLMMEALIAVGDAENPITKKKELNTVHAKFIIDTLAMLKEKTKTNLSKEEDEMLESILYELRMRFLNKASSVSQETA